MTIRFAKCVTLILTVFSMFMLGGSVRADDERTIGLADGKLVLEAPKGWTRKKPKSNIIEHEFSIPAIGDNKDDGRFTVMGAGGSVEDNIARWQNQFKQSDGSVTKDKTKTQKMQVNGIEVHYVDITGDFLDQAGPFNPKPGVVRDNYRMLAAIVVSDKLGQYFLKFYGPKELVTNNEKAFQDMVNSLKAK